MEAALFKTDFVPKQAILKEDVFSVINRKRQFAKKHEVVTVTELKGTVAIVQKENKEWFPVHINKLIIQE